MKGTALAIYIVAASVLPGFAQAFESNSTSFSLRANVEALSGTSSSASFRLLSADSQIIGGTSTSASFGVFAGFLKIILVAPAVVDLQQLHYRWRKDTLNEDWLAAANTQPDVQRGEPARLRIEVSNEGTANSAQTRFRIEYGTLVSSCASISAWSPVGNAGSTTPAWKMSPSNWITEGASTTNSTGLADENGTFLPGLFLDVNNETAPGFSMTGNPTAGHFSELEFSLVSASSVSDNTVHCFRLTNQGSNQNFTYSSYGQAKTIPPVVKSGGIGSEDTPSAAPPPPPGGGQGGGGESTPPPPAAPPPPPGGGQGGGGGESGYVAPKDRLAGIGLTPWNIGSAAVVLVILGVIMIFIRGGW